MGYCNLITEWHEYRFEELTNPGSTIDFIEGFPHFLYGFHFFLISTYYSTYRYASLSDYILNELRYQIFINKHMILY